MKLTAPGGTIVHIISGFSTGGAEVMLLKLLNSLDRERWPCMVISLLGRGTLGERVESLGIPLVTLDTRGGLQAAQGLLRLRRKLHSVSPALIQGWMPHGNLAALAAVSLRRKRPPVVWNVRQSLYDLRQEKRLTAGFIRIGARLSAWPARIIYNSRVSAAQHEALGFRGNRRAIIPNGFDVAAFKPSPKARTELRRRLEVGPDTIVIGLVARFHRIKDHGTFLRAAKLVATRNPDVRFVLAGQGTGVGNPELDRIIGDLRLAKLVYRLGHLEDVAPLTAGLDLACSSSKSEAFPNVLGEAMASGVPCVATDVGDSAWLLGGTGRVVPPGDPDAFGQACIELINLGANGRKALGLAARHRVEEHFEINHVVAQYGALYDQVLAESGALP